MLNKDLLTVKNDIAEYDFIDEGEIMGTYRGKFIFKCILSPIEEIDADRDFRQLVGEHASLINPENEKVALALVQLKYRVLKAPLFWTSEESRINGGHIKDINIISHVFAAAIDAEIAYRNQLKERKDKAQKILAESLQKRKEELSVNLPSKEEV